MGALHTYDSRFWGPLTLLRPALMGIGLLNIAGLILYSISEDDGQTDFRGFAVILALVGGLIYSEIPGDGRGTGQRAGALGPGLHILPRHSKLKADDAIPPPPLSEDGSLLHGHAYVIIFFTCSDRCVAKLPKVHKLARSVHAAAGAWVHTVLVSRSPRDDIEATTSTWPNCAVPIAHDSDSTAFGNYLAHFETYAVPQAFVVDYDGKIVWHGHVSRKAFAETCSKLQRRGPMPRAAAAAAAATAKKKES